MAAFAGVEPVSSRVVNFRFVSFSDCHIRNMTVRFWPRLCENSDIRLGVRVALLKRSFGATRGFSGRLFIDADAGWVNPFSSQ